MDSDNNYGGTIARKAQGKIGTSTGAAQSKTPKPAI